jgi:probable rRNA maturation factor
MQLPEIEVAIVSDRVIAQVHRDFMGIPGATDVITFEHGEIVMSAQTARAYAREYGHSTDRELALYTIHGLLHLNGYDDTTARAAARMHSTQDRVLRACLQSVPLS